MGIILKFIRWVVEKFASAILIVVLGLVACAVWYYLKDNIDFDERQRDTIRSISGERAKIQSALEDVHGRLARLTAEIPAQQEKGRQADKVIAQLRELESTWDKVLGDRVQQQANAQRVADVTKLRNTTTVRVATLQNEFTRTTWERDGLEVSLAKKDVLLRAAEAKRSKVMYYLELAWERTRGWIIAVLAFYFLGPTVGKLALYFWFAPWVMLGKPVRLRHELEIFPEIGASGVTADIVLGPGERLRVKEKFLQSSGEGLQRKTRYLLDWWMPFTCLASGLVELVEMSHRQEQGESRLTLSNQSDPHSELAVVTLAEGSAVVLRPSFIAGVVTAEGQRLKIRRRWQLFRWQAWVTLQFRFFEFVGPCRLVMAGSRGVRAEHLVEGRNNERPARRTNQDSTIGFTPNLEYRPVRAETFSSYYRGMSPLFDDLFAGRGIFLCQQIPAPGDAGPARKFWATAWGGMLKVFGL